MRKKRDRWPTEEEQEYPHDVPLDEIFRDPDPMTWRDFGNVDIPKRKIQLMPHDRDLWVPAARCRECGVLTWKLSLSGGRKRLNAVHRQGCSKPPSKFDREER